MSLKVEISHTYPDLALDISFDAPPGITVLFGPSGAGKTTVINAVAGLLRPDRAHISVDGHALVNESTWLPTHRRGIGYVFQDHRLFPHMSVVENLRYGNRFAPRGGAELAEDRVIDALGLQDLLGRRPAGLSGGEAARVGLGRALLARPRLILADEPLASLDAARKAEILPYFERLRDTFQIPILYVSHAAAEVARLATTVVALSKGRVVKAGPAMDVLSDPAVTPSGPRAAGAIIEARVKRHHDDGLSELDAGGVPLFLPRLRLPEGSPLRVRIAAQDVVLSGSEPRDLSALNVIPAQVRSIRKGDGPGALVALDSASGRLLARVTNRSVQAMDLTDGKKIWAVVKTVSIAPEDVSS